MSARVGSCRCGCALARGSTHFYCACGANSLRLPVSTLGDVCALGPLSLTGPAGLSVRAPLRAIGRPATLSLRALGLIRMRRRRMP